jgi:hypothetical protein
MDTWRPVQSDSLGARYFYKPIEILKNRGQLRAGRLILLRMLRTSCVSNRLLILEVGHLIGAVLFDVWDEKQFFGGLRSKILNDDALPASTVPR